MNSLTILFRCVACKATQEIDVNAQDAPMCPLCFSPMAAVSATASTEDNAA
jgi:Zn finger protein HypA/HybF involved in hydrogenase expression